VSYLYAAALEVSHASGVPGQAVTVRRRIDFTYNQFDDVSLREFLGTLSDIMRWRNKSGVGHGSLVLNKETYIKTLLKLGYELNLGLRGLSGFLACHGLSLNIPGGLSLTGPEYFSALREGGVVSSACCKNHFATLKIPPVLVMSHNFDGADIYFLDSSFQGVLRYRNFRKNKSRYLNMDLQPCWGADPGQVAWLVPAERESWHRYFFSISAVARGSAQLMEILADAAEQFQSRGMSGEVRWCLGLFEECGHPGGHEEGLALRFQMAHFGLEASLGNELRAQEVLGTARATLLAIGDEAQRRLARVKLALLQSWYQGVNGKISEALQICRSALEDIHHLKEQFPHSSSLFEMELRKNILYLSRRLQERDASSLREECLYVFQVAYGLYVGDPDNYKIVDIIGFACNLYGEYTLDLLGDAVQLGSSEVQEIEGLLDYGEKIRGRAYRSYPDDIWVMRGYAWCHHVRARFLRRLGQNQEVSKLLADALEVRRLCERKYPQDLGVKEDLIKNLAELIGMGQLSKSGKEGCIAAIRRGMAFILEKEGFSPRVKYLMKEIGKLAPGEYA